MAPIATPATTDLQVVQALPEDYLERVYAGVLGKLIGVYLGRPFEGWTHQDIVSKLGHIKGYVHDRLGVPCVVTDDDISGTFAFVRALDEHPGHSITSELIGKTWLNQIVEKKSLFWWGGRGISTEHTAFLNLKHGIPAPRSGSIDQNGKTVAEQIGAQIFIDGWAMVAPGRPELAAHLAEEAGRVSHDGESVYAAVLWAAMESEAFVSNDIEHLLNTGLRSIPSDCLIARAVAEVRTWVREDADWSKTRQRVEDKYGYDKFGGVCHVVPNHLVMVLSILYAAHDFDLVMEIVNNCGWDTDCNSGNVGCLVAIMNGMKSFEGKVDWRGPVADRAIISSADNGYSLNNAARIAIDIVNMGRRLAGKAGLPPPKDGAQFHFTLPGSVQGFTARSTGTLVSQEDKALVVRFEDHGAVSTPTHAAADIFEMGSTYPLSSSPLVYPGQRVSAVFEADANVKVNFRIEYYDNDEKLVKVDSEVSVTLSDGGGRETLSWTLPSLPQSRPMATLGVSCSSTARSGQSKVSMERMAISGAPNMTLLRPKTPMVASQPAGQSARFWDLQWVQGVTDYRGFGDSIYIANDLGRGLISCGTREWNHYSVLVPELSVKLGGPSGVAIRVQGLRRYYALLLIPGGKVSLVKVLDEVETQLAVADFHWKLDEKYEFRLEANGSGIRGEIGGKVLVAQDHTYKSGAMGLVASDGALSVRQIHIRPMAT